ncbi:MAG: alpha-N-acetylglucosaminidase C-terminal domain-containing protein [Spirochaetales bacterium]|nr:alpha-N-acetylglucosaminidase C-terminal domain-containing protein [Spirochaetales bacterium]
MKKVLLFIFCCTIVNIYSQENVTSKTQQEAAHAVIQRLLGEDIANFFMVEIISNSDKDFFEVKSIGEKIILRGDSGVSACRGLKWYLNNMYNCSISWREDNLQIDLPLKKVDKDVKIESPFKYRYIFNYCVFGYSFAFWDWQKWERMIDILAFNGINMPLALLGQEAAWQKTYEKFGLSKSDLNDFFSGPAFFPWQWMGNLDGWGGILPQSVIDKQMNLQKMILARQRSLGMRPVLAGFSGHIPKALIKKYPELKVNKLSWAGFPETYSLSWEEPIFKEISKEFIKVQSEIYGTDNLYAIDPFNEMEPKQKDTEFVSNMAKTIYNSMNDADPNGIWVIQTWCFKSPELPNHYWNTERTKAFFDAVPDKRMIALELHAESWYYTGWRKQSGWYGKPWIWSIVQNFGDRVDLYGGLTQIFDNYNKMQNSTEKGNIQGMGIMMEGLGYNPIVYELVFDMMWGDGVKSLEEWKIFYLKKRYGDVTENLKLAWGYIFSKRYSTYLLKDISPICYSPSLSNKDISVETELIKAWELMTLEVDNYKESSTFAYDYIHLTREVLSQFSGHYQYLLNKAWKRKNLREVKKIGDDFLNFIKDFDSLLYKQKDFRLEEWINDARNLGGSKEEADLMERNAKIQITRWTLGDDPWGLNNYAVKEWSGYLSEAIYPQWEEIISSMVESLSRGGKTRTFTVNKIFSHNKKNKFIENWIDSASGSYKGVEYATDEKINFARSLFSKYHPQIIKSAGNNETSSSEGILVGKKVIKSDKGSVVGLKNLNDGKVDFSGARIFRSTEYVVFDLGEKKNIYGFNLISETNWGRPVLYKIDISEDGDIWQTAVDQSNNATPPPKNGYLHTFKIFHPEGLKARFIRLIILNEQSSVVVKEFKAFGVNDEF